MFEGFEEFDVAVSGTTVHGAGAVRGRRAAAARHPRDAPHVAPRAPRLAERFTVVATDLRGYGDSGKPPSTADHAPYAMREIARDQVEVMRQLGPRAVRRRRARPGRPLRVPDGARPPRGRRAPRPSSTSSRRRRRTGVPTWSSAWASGSGRSSPRRTRCPRSSSPPPPRRSSTTCSPPGPTRRRVPAGRTRRVRRAVLRPRDGARDLRGVPGGGHPRPPPRRGGPRRSPDRCPVLALWSVRARSRPGTTR